MPAIRFDGANRLAVALFLCGTAPIPNVLLRDQRSMRLDGRTVAMPGDWVTLAPGGGKLASVQGDSRPSIDGYRRKKDGEWYSNAQYIGSGWKPLPSPSGDTP